MIDNKQTGAAGEKAAAEYLVQKGYTIAAMNLRFKSHGEIDIVARIKSDIHIIEVKTRSSDTYGLPSESVVKSKVRKLRFLAQLYLSDNADISYDHIRFDVIEVFVSRNSGLIQIVDINHIQDAF